MNTHELESLKARLVDLRLYGILNELQLEKTDDEKTKLILQLVTSEEQERRLRLVQSRVKNTRLKDLDPFSGFDWNWPKKIDRNQVSSLFNFDFMNERSNIVFLGPAGVGKTMIAKNLVHEAAKRGQTSIFIEAVDLLEELIENSNRTGISKTLEKFAKPQLLAIDAKNTP